MAENWHFIYPICHRGNQNLRGFKEQPAMKMSVTTCICLAKKWTMVVYPMRICFLFDVFRQETIRSVGCEKVAFRVPRRWATLFFGSYRSPRRTSRPRFLLINALKPSRIQYSCTQFRNGLPYILLILYRPRDASQEKNICLVRIFSLKHLIK